MRAWIKFVKSTLPILVILLLATQRALAAADYWRVDSAGLIVIGPGPAASLQQLASRFAVFEASIRELAALQAGAALHDLTVVALHPYDTRTNDKDVDRSKLRSQIVVGVLLEGSNNSFVVFEHPLHGNARIDMVCLLFAQSALSKGATRIQPIWHQIGVTNLLNGASYLPDGTVNLSRAMLFDPIPSKRQLGIKYDLSRLLQVNSDELKDLDLNAYTWIARAFAEFGLMTTPERAVSYRTLARLMKTGVSAEDAVQQAFGTTLNELNRELMSQSWRKKQRLTFKLSVPVQPMKPAMKLTENEADTLITGVRQALIKDL